MASFLSFLVPSPGKSTIVGLIERFYDVNEGQVLLDGKDVRSYNLLWLRPHVRAGARGGGCGGVTAPLQQFIVGGGVTSGPYCLDLLSPPPYLPKYNGNGYKVNLHNYPPPSYSLLTQIGIVSQEPLLFACSILDNIR